MPISTRLQKILICAATVLAFAACQQGENKTEKTADTTAAAKPATETKQYTPSMVDNKKDPTCGMPVTAGIGDTVHYKNKVIGFCSAECKAEFAKNPEAGLVAAELK